MAEVRRANLEELHEIVELGQIMHAESPRFSRYPFLPERLLETLVRLHAMKHACVFVAREKDDLVGFFFGVAFPHYACDFIQASDMALFVHPEYRGSTAAIRLVREFVKWAVAMGAEPSIGVNTGVHTERTGALLEALGGKHSGSTWTWGV